MTVYVPVPLYGAVPPVANTVTVLVVPLHSIDVAVDPAVSCVGSLTTTVVVDVQPFTSVIVYV